MAKLINIFDYERAAQTKIPESFFSYFAGSVADLITLHENRTVFNCLKLCPRVLADVSQRNLHTTVLEQSITMPVIIVPTAMAKLARADGEVAISG